MQVGLVLPAEYPGTAVLAVLPGEAALTSLVKSGLGTVLDKDWLSCAVVVIICIKSKL